MNKEYYIAYKQKPLESFNLYFTFHKSTVKFKGKDCTQYLNNFSDFPIAI